MQALSPTKASGRIPEFLAGGGELGEMIRSMDWNETPLGPAEQWPQSLKTCIRIMLTSRQPIWIGWGKSLIKFYNDPYKQIVGGKHPWALGTPAAVVWKDIWKDIEPMLRTVMEEDQGTYVESQLLIMERNGYPEETYYTFSYTPIPGDDGKTAGMFCANTDDTERIISERHLRTLTQLGKSLTDIQSSQEIIHLSINTLSENPYDFPFAAFITTDNGKARLAAATQLNEVTTEWLNESRLQEENFFTTSLRSAFHSRKLLVVDDVRERMGSLPAGAWQASPDKIIILPVTQSGKDPYGLLVVGLNPYRLPDENYLGFFSLVADQMATSFADVHLLEEERKRAEALAELDRVKTNFFSNISHEFRTPLTLLLGPIEEALNDQSTIPQNRERLEVALRNALRMQKLVNTLLDFSRIEAGRMEGRFSRVDICHLTIDLASSFRSAIEKAGMRLEFDCDPITQEVYLDVDLWEKIVLNLVSNAFKYSKAGTITLRLKELDGQIEFTVTDTGIGIPADQVEKIFDRFHRVNHAHGRSQEGTGIGLSMVKELVKIHSGTISVQSEEGSGSTFTVRIPTGRHHISDEKITQVHTSAGAGLRAFSEEAGKWIREDKQHISPIHQHTILVADDNADMRDYLVRLLSPHFNIITAVDGSEALEKAVQNLPDLVVSDIMMPRMDGFQLLQQLRAGNSTKNLPVIFLSARAGEEAKVEGLEAGADDYLVKPFAARELLARVEANIKISRSRQLAERTMRNMISQAPVAITIIQGKDYVIEMANEKALALWNRQADEVLGQKAMEVFPELVAQGFDQILQNVMTTGIAFRADERPVTFMRNNSPVTVFINFIYEPMRDINNVITGIMGIGIDVTDQVRARMNAEENEAYFRRLTNSVPVMIWRTDAEGNCIYLNKQWYDYTGQSEVEALGTGWLSAIHPDDIQNTADEFFSAQDAHRPFHVQYRLYGKDGGCRYMIDTGYPRFDSDGNFEGYVGAVVDVHEREEFELALEESEARQKLAIEAAGMGTWQCDLLTASVQCSEKTKEIFGFTDDVVALSYVFDTICEEDRERVQQAVQKAMTAPDGLYCAEYRLKNRSDQSVRWAIGHGRVFFDEKNVPVKFIGTTQDLTQQKLAEKALSDSEARFRQLAGAMPQLVWVANDAGEVLYYNERVSEYFGASRREDGMWQWQGMLHPDDVAATEEAWNNAVKRREVYQIEHRVQMKDGSFRWHLSRAFPQSDENGTVTKWFGTATDIQTAKLYAATLEEEVARRTAELQRLNVSLQQSNHELQQFAHVASHDLKEPLRKIKTFSDRLADDAGSTFSPSARLYLKKIDGAADRMSVMIEGVLNYSMLNAAAEAPQQVDLNQVMQDIESDLELMIQQKTATIHYQDLPTIEGAPVLLYQLFYNLLNNSLKFAREDRTAVIEVSSVTVKETDGVFADITVQDNGIGFHQQYAENIFNTFARLNSKDKFEGTGLGLALCKRIAERHGGRINAYSSENEGARFVVRLPFTQFRNII